MSDPDSSLTEEIFFNISVMPEDFIFSMIEYFVYFGVAFLALWVLLRPVLKHRKIQQQTKAGPSQWLAEVLWSAIAQAGVLVLSLTLIPLSLLSQFRLYEPGDDAAWWVSAIGICAILVLDDTWFYWTHRWLHTNKTMYRKVHLIHHGSTDTTPLTGFRFHPLELFIINFYLPFLTIFVEFDIVAYIVGYYFSTFNNIYAHGGYELLPSFWRRIPLLKFKTLSIHHNMHHERVRGNYALYFTWWDRWMGTEFSDYTEREDNLYQRIKTESPLERIA